MTVALQVNILHKFMFILALQMCVNFAMVFQLIQDKCDKAKSAKGRNLLAIIGTFTRNHRYIYAEASVNFRGSIGNFTRNHRMSHNKLEEK